MGGEGKKGKRGAEGRRGVEGQKERRKEEWRKEGEERRRERRLKSFSKKSISPRCLGCWSSGSLALEYLCKE